MTAKKITGNKEHPELDFQRDHTWIKSSQIFFKRLFCLEAYLGAGG